MTKREIASLACKLLSIYAIINAVGSLQGFVTTFFSAFRVSSSALTTGEMWILLLSAMPFILQSIFAVFLWLLSDGLAIVMAKDESINGGNSTSSLNAHDILLMAFAIIGVLQIGLAIPFFVRGAVVYLLPPPRRAPFDLFSGRAFLLSALAQLAIGLYLLFGSRGLVRFVLARHARHNDTTL